MSDKVKGLVVAFDRDLSEDDAEKVADAIRLLTWVADVQVSLNEPSASSSATSCYSEPPTRRASARSFRSCAICASMRSETRR